jgi:hypothetical protein
VLAVALLEVARAAGGPFDHVHVGERPACELRDDVGGQRLRIEVGGVRPFPARSDVPGGRTSVTLLP